MAGSLLAIVNGDFEAGDLSGWNVSFGSGSGQEAVTVTAGPAANTAGALNEVYAGVYACRLNSGTLGAHSAFARISQDQLISSGNTILEFYYAAVLDGAHAAIPSDDAYMTVEILNGAVPILTRTYAYGASPAALVDDGVPQKRHLPWTQILVDLSAYNGVTITVQFTAYDCNYGGHYSQAYVDGFHFIPPTPTITPTLSDSPSFTYSPTVTVTPTISPSFTITNSFTITQSYTDSPTVTPTPTITDSFTQSDTPTVTNSFTITQSHTYSPTVTATPTITPTFTLTPRPLLLHLLPPSPNPSSGELIWLPYFVSVDSNVDIVIYSVAGEKVRSLNPVWTAAGYSERQWDMKNESGQRVASGTYIYKVRAESARGELESDFSKCAVFH